MKTRSNMPLFVVECSDVKALSNSQIDLLRCGDYLVKKDASGEHAYKVTFKKDGVGMCLTYHDASVIETQSYDYVDGNWVYNSEDKTPNLLDVQTEDDVKSLIEGGTINNAKPIYCHPISLASTSGGYSGTRLILLVFTNSAEPFTKTSLLEFMDNFTGRMLINGFIISGTTTFITSYVSDTGNIVVLKNDGTYDAIQFSAIVNNSGITLADDVNKIN